MSARFIVPFCLSLLLGPVAFAAPAAVAESDAHVARGFRLAKDLDFAGALLEFQRAQALAPNQEILYDIGMAQARLGHPVEAVAALDAALAGNDQLAPHWLAQAQRERAEQARRIARLLVRAKTSARVFIDNVAVGQVPMTEPVALASGNRQLTVITDGHEPFRQDVALTAGQIQTLDVELRPITEPLAQLGVQCDLPGADIVLDGKVVGRTPLHGVLAVTAGLHQLVLRRSGYRDASDAVTVSGGAARTLSLTPVEWLEAGNATGALQFRISEPDADVVIDGRPRPGYRDGLRLAAGVHDALIRRNGFFPVRREVVSPPSGSRLVSVTLEPTEETRLAQVSRATSQRRWAWIVVGVGAVLAGGATYLYVHNQDELRAADAQVGEVRPMLQPGGQCFGETTPRCAMLVDNANARLDSAQHMRSLAIIGMGTGAAILVAGAVLRLLSDDPHRYDYEGPDDRKRGVGVFAGPQLSGAAVGLSGRF